MFAKLIVLIGLVGYAAAVCQCSTKPANQKDVWNNATVVAHVKIDKVSRPVPSTGSTGSRQNGNNNGGNNGGSTGATNGNNEITYNVTYIETFKPKGGSNSSLPQTVTTPSSTLDCGVPFLAQGVEYLISGKRQGSALEITSCTSFPIVDNGIQSGPIVWGAVPQELKQKLQNGQF